MPAHLDAAYAALAALSRTVPWSVEPDESGIAATGHGPHAIARPPTTGHTEQQTAEVARPSVPRLPASGG
ncbi:MULTISPECIES: hypothetical protein [unclassified Streptomyces]|uniref:hypothetical protein n=1 Tax=unclassified Streptomyces TaxID=2593676 RepID=UPI00225B8317|nr:MULTISPECIES: hypothetical protein [unclassified Streptomyces]MCX4648012.1 hypothetical protein [Streptomyces sp. NBC_01446]MCX5323829.1 hypothetical protein [Streptomyces sp. NBC_00120]